MPAPNHPPPTIAFAVLAANGKADKRAVSYLNTDPQGNYQCGRGRGCGMFINDKKRCTAHPPAQVIESNYTCNHWGPGDPATGKDPHGMWTWLDSGLAASKAGFGCMRCDNFLADKLDCQKVNKDSEGPDPGHILPRSCCDLWEGKEVPIEKGPK